MIPSSAVARSAPAHAGAGDVVRASAAGHVVLLSNPRSGLGKGPAIAGKLARALHAAGFTVESLQIAPGSDARLAEALRGARALVVVGGDGTLHHVAPLAADAGTPVYHAPLGNENLFAREFGMDRRPRTLLKALEAHRTERVDMGVLCAAPGAAERPFLLMCSLGPDASIIHRLEERPRGLPGHLAYAVPIAQELLRPRFPRLTIEADGERIVTDTPGFAIIANSRQYASRIDPALRASMTDGLLDVVFMPCRSRLGAVRWALSARIRRHVTRPEAIYLTARSVTLTAGAGELLYQLDGEAGPRVQMTSGPATATMTVRPGGLAVLLPASR